MLPAISTAATTQKTTHDPGQADDDGGHAEGTARIYFDFHNCPLTSGCSLNETLFERQLTEITCALAQDCFAPVGDTISVKTSGDTGKKSYEWKTRDGWEVGAGSEGTVWLFKRPKHKEPEL